MAGLERVELEAPVVAEAEVAVPSNLDVTVQESVVIHFQADQWLPIAEHQKHSIVCLWGNVA